MMAGTSLAPTQPRPNAGGVILFTQTDAAHSNVLFSQDVSRRAGEAISTRAIHSMSSRVDLEGASKEAAASTVSGDPILCADRLNKAAFELKVLLGQYAMHMASADRSLLIETLNDLLDPEEWHDDDVVPKVESFQAFLKWALYSHWHSYTSLGFSHSGNLLVAWRRGADRVTAEMFDNQEIKWTVTTTIEGKREIAAGRCQLSRFPSAILSHLPNSWQMP